MRLAAQLVAMLSLASTAALADGNDNDRCVTGLSDPQLHPGWTLDRRQDACREAGADCVLTLARLRRRDNEILLNEECRHDYANCAGKLAAEFSRHQLEWYRGDMRWYCADDDLACVVDTRVAHPDWPNTDVHDHCLRP